MSTFAAVALLTSSLGSTLHTRALDDASRAYESLRRQIVEYKLDFDSVLREPSFRDSERLKDYPGNTWPKTLTLDTEAHQRLMRDTDTAATGYDSRQKATFVFSTPLTVVLQPREVQTLLFLKGIEGSGAVVANNYSLTYCEGPMKGVLTLNSYATAVIKGDLRGRMTSASYFNGVVAGDLAGSYENESSCLLYVEGRVTGSVRLRPGAKLVIYGKTQEKDLARITGSGAVWLMNSDMEAGTTKVGKLSVTVVK